MRCTWQRRCIATSVCTRSTFQTAPSATRALSHWATASAATRLRKLILLGNGIGPRGVAALADALRIKPALNTLNLRLNHLGETAAAELLSAVKHAKSIAAGGESLTSLDLEYNTVVPTHGLHQPEPVSEHLLVELEGVLLMSSGSAASGASPSEADAPTTIGTQSYVG